MLPTILIFRRLTQTIELIFRLDQVYERFYPNSKQHSLKPQMIPIAMSDHGQNMLQHNSYLFKVKRRFDAPNPGIRYYIFQVLNYEINCLSIKTQNPHMPWRFYVSKHIQNTIYQHHHNHTIYHSKTQ